MAIVATSPLNHSLVAVAAAALTALSLVVAAPASATAGDHSGARHDAGTVSRVTSAGHDKCKRPKGYRRLLPWCTDPAAGWTGATTHRANPNSDYSRSQCNVGE